MGWCSERSSRGEGKNRVSCVGGRWWWCCAHPQRWAGLGSRECREQQKMRAGYDMEAAGRPVSDCSLAPLEPQVTLFPLQAPRQPWPIRRRTLACRATLSLLLAAHYKYPLLTHTQNTHNTRTEGTCNGHHYTSLALSPLLSPSPTGPTAVLPRASPSPSSRSLARHRAQR